MGDGVGEAPGADSPKVLSGQTEVFLATGEPDPDRPVVVFQHIQKTAGTALRRVIRDNLPPAERSVGRVRRLRDRTDAELRAFYADWWAGLDAPRRASVCCVMAHTANHLLPVLDRPVRALTVVRDPVDRAVSQWYFQKRNAGKPFGVTGNPVPERYRQPHGANLDDVYAQLSGASPADSVVAFRHARYFNGQSRSLLGPHHDTAALRYTGGPEPDAGVWRERLFAVVDEHYRAGAQEHFDEFVDELCAAWGWRRAIPRAKVNEQRPRLSALPEETAAAIRAHNWLDAELHRHVAARFAGAAAAEGA